MAINNLRKIGYGRTAEVFDYDSQHILKLFKPNWSPILIERELHLNNTAYNAALPVPKCIEKIHIEGRHGLIFEKLDGPTMLVEFNKKPWEIVRLSKQFAKLHSLVHSLKIDTGVSLKSKIKEDLLKDLRYRKGGLALLDNLSDGNSLLHGDFHPGNIILTKDGPYIIDWISGSTGSPLADAAMTVILLKYAALPDKNLSATSLIKLGRLLSSNLYLHYYKELNNVSKSDIKAWLVPLLVARLSKNIPRESGQLETAINKLMR